MSMHEDRSIPLTSLIRPKTVSYQFVLSLRRLVREEDKSVDIKENSGGGAAAFDVKPMRVRRVGAALENMSRFNAVVKNLMTMNPQYLARHIKFLAHQIL